jgi:stringent starvation protein B
MAFLDKKAYLIRGIYGWCIDSGYTPYIKVNLSLETVAPKSIFKNNEIVLNLSPTSINHLEINDSGVSFKGRFSGKLHQIFLPIDTVIGIYNKENGEGVFFSVEKEKITKKLTSLNTSKAQDNKKIHLRIVK